MTGKTKFLFLPFYLNAIHCDASLRGSLADVDSLTGSESEEHSHRRRTQSSSAGYVNVIGACTYENALAAYSAEFGNAALAQLASHLNVNADASSVTAAVTAVCNNASKPTEALPFEKVTQFGTQVDATYMNTGYMGEISYKSRIQRAYDNGVMSYPLSWPNVSENGSNYMGQFENCSLRAAMCCKVSTDHTGDSQICAHDNQRSAMSNYFFTGVHNGGYTIFSDDSKAQCTAFAWSSNAADISQVYRANALFEISMWQDSNADSVKSVPGAPLCGCVEHMPVVTEPECVNIVEGWRFQYTFSPLFVSFDAQVVSCEENSFTEHYASVSSIEEQSSLSKFITDDCTKAHNDRFISKGTFWWDYTNDTKAVWEPFAGNGIYEDIGIGDKTTFDNLFNLSPNKIVRRICRTCWPSHKDIYYKRITAVPATFDLYDNLLNNWFSENNSLNEDFELYSTYSDAIAGTNKWTYCNYDDENVGFPRDCGPNGYTPSNWSNLNPGRGKNNVIFMVEQ